jgi:hypothetical protein
MKNWVLSLPWPRIACLLHALLVCGIWVLVFKFDLDVMPGKLWMVIALAWLLWLGAVVLSRRENRMRWIIVIAIGVLLLAPTIPTLYTFIVWSVEGFAP